MNRERIYKDDTIKAINGALAAWSDMPQWRDDHIAEAIEGVPPIPEREDVLCKDCTHNIEPEFGFCECANHHVSPDSCCAKVFHAERRESAAGHKEPLMEHEIMSAPIGAMEGDENG